MRCLDAGAELARRNNGVIDKSNIERQAIKDARRPLAEVLTELGLMPAFADRTPEEIDRIIETCVDGFQDSVRRQSDDIPF